MDVKTSRYCSSLFLLSLFSHLQNHQHHKTCWKDLKMNKTIIVLVQGPVAICCQGEGGGGEGLDDVTMKFTSFPHPKADCNILMLLLISNYWAFNFL